MQRKSSQQVKVMAKSHDNLIFTRKLTEKVVTLLILLPVLVVSTDKDKLSHRPRDGYSLEPCKAATLWGDVALSDEEFRATGKMLLEEIKKNKLRTDLLELQPDGPGTYKEKYKQQLQKDLHYLAKILEGHAVAVIDLCKQHQLQNKTRCRLNKSELREEITKICEQWKRLKKKIKLLKQQDFGQKSSIGKLRIADKRSSKRYTKKETVQVKQTGVNFSYNRRAQRKKNKSIKSPLIHRRAAIANRSMLWKYGVIPYVIDGNFSANHRISFKQAMEQWENHTCLTFKEKEPEDQDYILFTSESCGCCSFVGKIGSGAQPISISWVCNFFDIILHELGHVIGFEHEHKRPDRDEHVEIIHSNISPGREKNFIKLNASDVDSLGEPYDFDSIMHYYRNTFAEDLYVGTIVPKRIPGTNHTPTIGRQTSLSAGDIRQTNKLYSCPSCVHTLFNTSGKFNYTSTPDLLVACHWRVFVPRGMNIVLNITHFNITPATVCRRGNYLEIRDGHYFKSPLLGRYCRSTIPPIVTSTGSRMWVKFRTIGRGHKSFAASYEVTCGGQINKNEGLLVSPNYPREYPNQQKCIWRITVDDGFVISVTFDFFLMEDTPNCQSDYLEFRDGLARTSPFLSKHCGNRSPGIINSTANHLYVKFVSDRSANMFGFSASFAKSLANLTVNDVPD